MKKKLINGKIAVLVSYGYGAGWYTWHENEEMLFDPTIVEMVLNEEGETAIVEYCKTVYPDAYTGGVDGLTVEFVSPSTKFRIEEYDGAETLVREEDYNWFEA
jgi:hypothetical protein